LYESASAWFQPLITRNVVISWLCKSLCFPNSTCCRYFTATGHDNQLQEGGGGGATASGSGASTAPSPSPFNAREGMSDRVSPPPSPPQRTPDSIAADLVTSQLVQLVEQVEAPQKGGARDASRRHGCEDARISATRVKTRLGCAVPNRPRLQDWRVRRRAEQLRGDAVAQNGRRGSAPQRGWHPAVDVGAVLPRRQGLTIVHFIILN
jgi:hypothetical protein